MTIRALFTIGGALLGAVIGHLIFMYLADRGVFGFAIPGAMVALGAGLNNRCPARWVALVSAMIAFLAGNFSVWKRLPFVQDTSFKYSLLHFFDRPAMTWILILVASVLAFWFAWRRSPNPKHS